MATNLIYRQSSTPVTPGSTSVKNSPLTNLEVDGNFKSISDDLGTKATTTALNAGIQAATDNAIALAIALG